MIYCDCGVAKPATWNLFHQSDLPLISFSFCFCYKWASYKKIFWCWFVCGDRGCCHVSLPYFCIKCYVFIVYFKLSFVTMCTTQVEKTRSTIDLDHIKELVYYNYTCTCDVYRLRSLYRYLLYKLYNISIVPILNIFELWSYSFVRATPGTFGNITIQWLTVLFNNLLFI